MKPGQWQVQALFPEAARRGELVIELLSEEIPAGMQRRAITDLTGLLRDKLAGAEIPAASVHGYVTPRRLAVIATGIPETQPDRTEERRGPRVCAAAPAIQGFLRSAGIGSIAQCEIRDTDRGEFYFAVLKRPGRPAAEVLPNFVKAAIVELPWPKSMRYPASSLRWVRPLTSVICMFEGEVLPLSLDQIPVGHVTRGHRFLSPGKICITSAAEYEQRLRDAHVVLNQDLRTEKIREDLQSAAAADGLAPKPDAELLEEVTGLAEFPIVLAGAIDNEFMTLPPEVLTTAMRAHQRYFSCLRSNGTLAPRFLFVADNIATDGGELIIAGNERVLRARLADARFFWDQDRRMPLETRVEALSRRVFHAKLGSLRDKVARLERLAEFLAPYVAGADIARSVRAVRLAKADLSSAMVGEFPELQGIMGRYYALHDGEHPAVADAIAEHYKPLGPNDACPIAPDSVVAALADKIDSLVAFFAIGEKPTGSRDPFGLRRSALGIIRLILENHLRRVELHDCLLAAATPFVGFRDETEVAAEVFNFISERLAIHLREQGIPYCLFEAVLMQGDLAAKVFGASDFTLEENFVRLIARIEAIQRFLASEDGVNLLTAFRRASNIVEIEERKDRRKYGEGEIDPEHMPQIEERSLLRALSRVGKRTEIFLKQWKFELAMATLATLRQPVDAFFEKVTVNTADKKLRANRLLLLSRIRSTFNQVADFSRIEG